MVQDRKRKKLTFILRKLTYIFTPQSRLYARMLDSIKEQALLMPDPDLPKALPGEFNKMIAIMEERGIEPGIRKQLKTRVWLRRTKAVIQKPGVCSVSGDFALGCNTPGRIGLNDAMEKMSR